LPYPKVGTKLSAVKVGVIPAIGGKTNWFKIPGDPANNYLARMDFIPHSSEVMVQQLNRRQDSNKIWIGNVNSMSLKNIYTESDPDFLDLHDDIRWLDGEKYFTWTSEKDGWQHLYKVSRDGRQSKLITKGNFDVVRINCIDPENGYVYYIASPNNFTQRYLYRSKIDGSGEAERVTPARFAGQSSYQISGNSEWAIQTFQNTTIPPIISLIHLPDHKEVRTL
jgi:dipeptidyl-peptidase-4